MMRDLINILKEGFVYEDGVELLKDFPPIMEPMDKRAFGNLTFTKQAGGSANGNMWVAWKDGKPIGAFAEDWRDDALVIHPEIEPAYQRKGYGSIIYDFAEQLADDAGVTLQPAYLQSGAAKAFWNKRRGGLEEDTYHGEHTAPTHDGDAPLYDLTVNGIYPDDIYSGVGLQYYASDTPNAYYACLGFKGRPNKQIIVYRAVPADVVRPKINLGDWVTISRAYARYHGESNLKNNFKIIRKTVCARDIYTEGNSLDEWGYDPQPFVPRMQENEIRKRLGMPSFEELQARRAARNAENQVQAEPEAVETAESAPPTIVSATTKNGIDRKKANRMVDPKGYFHPKLPMSEDAHQDIGRNAIIDKLYRQVYRYIHDKNDLLEFNIDDIDMLGIFLRDVPDIDPLFSTTALAFMVGTPGKATISHMKEPIHGATKYVVFQVRKLSAEGILTFLSHQTYAFNHEMVHLLDSLRYKRPIGQIPYSGPEQGKDKYYNDPSELNAYFHNLAEPLLDRIQFVRENGPEIAELFDKNDVPNDFRAFLAKRVKSMYPQDVRTYWNSLSEKNKRRVIARLHNLFNTYWKMLEV